MSGNTLSNARINEFKYWTQRVIPQVYDDSLSHYELLNKVITHLNNIGSVTNEFIEKYFDMIGFIDDELAGHVIAILDKWKQTGDLDMLLTDFLDLYTNQMSKKINQSSYIDGVEIDKFVYSGNGGKTTVYLTKLPKTDENGKKVVLKRGFAKDDPNSGKLETARDFANRHKASAVFNASIFNNTSDNKLLGNQVWNGQILRNDTELKRDYRWYLGIKKDGLLKSYPNGTTNSQMIADGCEHVLTGFYPVMVNGERPPAGTWEAHPGGADIPYIRQVLAQTQSGQYVFLTSQGYRNVEDEFGLSMEDCYNILIERFPNDRIMNAYSFDGGGSAQSVVYGTMVNHATDAGATERLVPDFLYVGKDETLIPRDNDIFNAYKMIGLIKQQLSEVNEKSYDNYKNHKGYYQLINDNPDYNSFGIETWTQKTGKPDKSRITKLELAKGRMRYIDVSNNNNIIFEAGEHGITDVYGKRGRYNDYAIISSNLNTALTSGHYWATPGEGKNTPDSSISWSVDCKMLNTTAGLQIATAFSSPYTVKRRRYNNGSWSDWE